MRIRDWVAVLVLVVLAVVGGLGVRQALASGDDDRARIIEQINDKLGGLADRIERVVSAFDGRDVDESLRIADELERLFSDLDRVKGDDDRAKHIVDYYPGYLRAFRAAAASLRTLKDRQVESPKLVAACRAFATQLDERVRAVKDDPRAVEALTQQAREIGSHAVEAWNDAQRIKDTVERARDDAKNFSVSDGTWSNVTSRVRDGADRTLDQWRRDYEQAKPVCEEASKGEHTRVIEDALKRLLDSTQGRQIILKQIAEEITDLVKLVDAADRDGDDADIKSAERDASDMKSLLDRLKSAQGDDARAREMADKWPGELEKMSAALTALDEEKDYQFIVDRAPERCKATDEQITRAAENLERFDPLKGDIDSVASAADSLDEITRQAREGLIEALKKATEAKRTITSLRGQAKDRWSANASELRPIDEKLNQSADAIATYYEKAEETAEKVCEEPAKGPEHKAAKRAKKKMFGDCTKEQYIPLRKPVKEHCKEEGAGPERCEPAQSCDELRAKRDTFLQCKQARRNLRDGCYRNSPDPGHEIKIGEMQNGADRCNEVMRNKSC
jgi:hypothetical protein